MYIEQLYTGCLAEAAYYIESEGEAAVIDPLRETEPYLELAKKRGAKIKFIFETHFHADFVSGHIDLSRKSGAPIVFGPKAETNFEIIKASDGQRFKLGSAEIEVLHTPGHTPESTCYLLRDEQGLPHSIYTGDTLFIGDVGRPDLAQKDGSMTAEDMAGTLYDSLRSKILPLPDHIVVYPAHGAGSACGKNMSKETFATLGEQKRTNYALGNISRSEFIKELTTGILPPPQYFSKAAAQNKAGYLPIEVIYERSLIPLDANQVQKAQEDGALILDTRHESAFRKGHIPNSWFIGLHGQFAPWAGALISDMHKPIVIIADSGKEQEAVLRLARVGYDNVLGYLNGGFDVWKAASKDIAEVSTLSPEDYVLQNPNTAVIDVRKQSEYDNCHLPDAQLVPLDYLHAQLEMLDPNKPYLIHCKGGYRSVIAWSVLTAEGFKHISDIPGGFDALKTAGAKYVQPQSA